MQFDPEVFGQLMADAVRRAVTPLKEEIDSLRKQLSERPDIKAEIFSAVDVAVKAIPTPKDGKDADIEDIRRAVAEEVANLPKPENGKDADMAEVRRMVEQSVKEAVAAIPAPDPGKSITLDDVRPVLNDAVAALRKDADEAIGAVLKQAEVATNALYKAVGELRQPEDGKSISTDDVRPVIEEAIRSIRAEADEKVAAAVMSAENAAKAAIEKAESLRQPEDGKSVTLDDIRPLIDESVGKIKADVESVVGAAIKSIPKVEDGKSVTVEDVAPMIRDEIQKAVAQIPRPGNGKDGVGLAGMLIDRDGNLVATMTNGETKNLGPVVGKDGVSLESFELEYIADTHEVCIKASANGQAKEIRYPAGGVHHKGYWRDGMRAKAGEIWTHQGTSWVAMKDTETRPGEDRDIWVIHAQKGKDAETIIKRVKDGPAPPIKLHSAKPKE